MKIIVFLFLMIMHIGYAQTIGTFTSVQPSAQSQLFVLPSTHTFQRIIKTGDPITGGTGSLPTNLDFTAYVPISGSSTNGYLSLNHETTPGAVTVLDINFNTTTKSWVTTAKNNVNLTAIYTMARNCSGGITPWGTVLSAEESTTVGDNNGDGYDDVGWLTEINPVTRTATRKIWAAGRCAHENAAIKSDGTLLYTGADESTQGYLYKYVFTTPNDPTSGTLYALRRTGTTGTWLTIANTTQTQRNTTGSLAQTAGATNFNGIEDVEFGPDGKIYFTSKAFGEVYRFTDNGTTVSNFEVFVGGSATNYTINYGTGTASENWGTGNDNLAFDGDGNLWVLQDGGRNHIWMVKPTHTQASPKVELFGKTPAGSEPTGITFTPDYKFMFISFQHPDGTNSATQNDALNVSVTWNTATTIVVALKNDLGLSSLAINSLTLYGQHQGDYNRLAWSNIDRPNWQTLEIEKSEDRAQFSTVALFNYNFPLNNSYHHYFQNKNNLYYRLKLMKTNQQITYSNIIKIVPTQSNVLQINKINSQRYNVSFLLNTHCQYQYVIYSTDGKLITQGTKMGNAGINNLPIDVQQYAKGQYVIHLRNDFFNSSAILLKE